MVFRSVNSLAAPAGRELDARHEIDGCRTAGLAGLAEPGGGVVVGESQRGNATGPRPLDQRGRGQHAIGKMAMSVEIDQGFAACIHSGVRMIRAA